jgi:hypothetical protein
MQLSKHVFLFELEFVLQRFSQLLWFDPHAFASLLGFFVFWAAVVPPPGGLVVVVPLLALV